GSSSAPTWSTAASPPQVWLSPHRPRRENLSNAHYRRRREHGDFHAAAQRNLFNRMIGHLYHCLQRRELFDESTAFPTELVAAA
ncbi:hypothetical protein AB0L67_41955, partial [Streptomyces flaveolus]